MEYISQNNDNILILHVKPEPMGLGLIASQRIKESCCKQLFTTTNLPVTITTTPHQLNSRLVTSVDA